jgi:DNA-binding CsgD family transcriptional regulator
VPTTDLTPREAEVLQLVVEDLSNEEIADRLGISRRTAETHVRTLFKKTGATRRRQLAMLTAADRAETPTPAPAAERRLALYADTVRRLADRHLALFEEQVELTFFVGDVDDQDHVLERRLTRPKEYLVYRILRPIVADPELAPLLDPDELQLDCLVPGQDVQADASSVLDDEGLPQTVVLFQPGLRDETEWLLRYRSPGLWEPLRRTGRDTLTWATGTADRRHRPTLTELTVHVVFPAGWRDPGLAEQNGQGVVRAEPLPGDRVRLTWVQGGTDDPPIMAAYDWVLRGTSDRPAGPV